MWRRRFLHQEITETVGAVDNDCMLPVWNHHLLSLAWYKWAYRTRQGINLLLLAIAQKGHFHTESDRFYYDRRGSCSFLLLSFLSAHIFDSTCRYSKYIWCNFFFRCLVYSFHFNHYRFICSGLSFFGLNSSFVVFEMAKTYNWRYLSLNVIQPIL